MDCKLLPLTPDVWRAYLQICEVRGYRPPQPPQSGVFVAGSTGRPQVPYALLSGAVLEPVDTRFAVLKDFVTNPAMPMRARYVAAEATLRAARTLATLMGRTLVVRVFAGEKYTAMLAPPRLVKFLFKRGFRFGGERQDNMFCPPGMPVPWTAKRRAGLNRPVIWPPHYIQPAEPKKPEAVKKSVKRRGRK